MLFRVLFHWSTGSIFDNPEQVVYRHFPKEMILEDNINEELYLKINFEQILSLVEKTGQVGIGIDDLEGSKAKFIIEI